MKKTILGFVFLFFINNVYSQNDTIFIEKVSENKIFILQNKQSEYHQILSNFKRFPNYSATSEKGQIINVNWIPLYKFKDQFYLYSPCDIGEKSRILISKKAITIEGFEFYNYKICETITKPSGKKYRLKYKGGIDGKEKITIEISIIDEINRIAVFKFINGKQIYYQLMLDAAKINNYHVIVNHCEFSKANEFQFEEIDYGGLLNNIKK